MNVCNINVGVLMYVTDSTYIHKILMNPDGNVVHSDSLPWEVILPKIDTLLAAMEQMGYSPNGIIDEFNRFSHEWGVQLLPSSGFLKRLDVLVIIPHYILHRIPFHTIWIDSEKRYLAQIVGITYCSSMNLFVRCVDRNPARQPRFHEWKFDLKDGSYSGSPPTPQSCYIAASDVTSQNDEQYWNIAAQFADHFEVKLADRGHPRISSKSYARDGVDVLCFVTHGHTDSMNSDASGLLLEEFVASSVRIPRRFYKDEYFHFFDYPFFEAPLDISLRKPDNHFSRFNEPQLFSIAELKVDCYTNAQLIALLGCSTGVGSVLAGDDYNSLANFWLKAGASSALSTLWELDSEFISTWIPLFLDFWLKRRLPKALAWREAMISYLASNSAASLYQWGVVSLSGDWI